MTKNNKAVLSRQNGGQKEELMIQNQEIDAPVLPVDQLERLNAINPNIVDWVIRQTEQEANIRRKRQIRIDAFVFIERLLGQIFGLSIGIGGILGGAYVAIDGQSWAGAIIASAAIGTLAVAFIKQHQS